MISPFHGHKNEGKKISKLRREEDRAVLYGENVQVVSIQTLSPYYTTMLTSLLSLYHNFSVLVI